MELRYKGFLATVRYSAATQGFYGEVHDTPMVVAFQSSDLAGVESVFKRAVEQYLQHLRVVSLGL